MPWEMYARVLSDGDLKMDDYSHITEIRRQETAFEKPKGKVIWCPEGCGRPALLKPDGSWYCMIGHHGLKEV